MNTLLHRPVVLNILAFVMLVLCLVAVAEVFYIPFAGLQSPPAPSEPAWQYTQRSAMDVDVDLPGSDGDGLVEPLIGNGMAGTATATVIDLRTGRQWLT